LERIDRALERLEKELEVRELHLQVALSFLADLDVEGVEAYLDEVEEAMRRLEAARLARNSLLALKRPGERDVSGQ